MPERPSVSLVIPVFNEEASLDELVARCVEVGRRLERPFEIILVDDGSSDASGRKIAEAAERYPGSILGVFLNRNYGQHAAVFAGLAESRGEFVVTLDADLQNPPEEIPKLVAATEEGHDVVGSVRVPRQDSIWRRLPSLFVNKTVQLATGVAMHDYGCMLRAYRRHVVEAMLACREQSTFIPVLANSFARRTTEVEVRHQQRAAGASKYGLWKLVNLQFDLLTSITTFPLRVLSLVGALISAAGVGFGLLILVMRFLYGSGWAAGGVFTLFAILFFFVGAQFVGLGLLGEYIGRIHYNARGRPRYFVQHIVGKSAVRDESLGVSHQVTT